MVMQQITVLCILSFLMGVFATKFVESTISWLKHNFYLKGSNDARQPKL